MYTRLIPICYDVSMNELSPNTIKDLLDRTKAEQALREEWGLSDNEELRLKVLALDSENTAFLKQLVANSGWPKLSTAGKEAATAAWLIVQHSPDKVFRKHCLDLMQENPSEVEPQNLARTVDRVRIDEGKQQYFGTHFMKGQDGSWEPMPIEDEKNVEARRAEYNLPTLEAKIKEYNK